MKKRLLGTAVVFMSLGLPSCASIHTGLWAYKQPSAYNEGTESQEDWIRPAMGTVMMPAALAWDLATFPAQVIFGVWPYWGEASLHYKLSDYQGG